MQECRKAVEEMGKKGACMSVTNGNEIGDSIENWPVVSAVYICIL